MIYHSQQKGQSLVVVSYLGDPFTCREVLPLEVLVQRHYRVPIQILGIKVNKLSFMMYVLYDTCLSVM